MFKKISARIDIWAAKRLQRRIKGVIFSEGPSISDPMHVIGGWVYGDGWHITWGQPQRHKQISFK